MLRDAMKHLPPSTPATEPINADRLLRDARERDRSIGELYDAADDLEQILDRVEHWS